MNHTRSTRTAGPRQPIDPDQDLLQKAISGVLRNAQNGELPVFAWTLGLAQDEWLEMLGHCFPGLGELERMSDEQYASLLKMAPEHFHAMAMLLLEHRSAGAEGCGVGWLARAIAAACYGSRHLWEDLDLGGREAVSRLMKSHFRPLHDRNVHNLRWKRFLFSELGAMLGVKDCQPPSCRRCDQYPVCFPPSERA